MEKNDPGKRVRHVAVIMDGNGRWAAKRNLPRLEGHRRGAQAVKAAIKTSRELGIEYLTLYAFSTENWKRPQQEIDGLLDLLEEFIDSNLDELQKRSLRLLASGRIREFPARICDKIKNAVTLTAGNTAGTLILALNYGGRAEIVDAARELGEKIKKGLLQPEEIDEEVFSRHLYVPEVPDPDIIIRTSGEFRLSNFLLWELSYSEIYITDVLWPDFGREEFIKAIESCLKRERRFGGGK
ncbi:MAG: polyprenyl diphosphate synthase [Victivallales bacterium]|nr:polyprenyl diphosphate synthase [Victivallales bacterium]